MSSVKVTIAVGLAALSLTIAWAVATLKLPLYLDSFGIVCASILLGWRYGVLTALLIISVGFFVVSPYLSAYVLTSILLAIGTAFLYSRGMFNNIVVTVFSALVLALLAALSSAPVTAYLFGGNTLSGVDAITAYLSAAGNSLINSVLITGLTSEPVDKTIVCVVSYLAIRSLPKRMLEENGLRSIPKVK